MTRKKAENYNKNGLQLFHDEKFEEAISFFTKAIEIDPTYPEPFHYRGQALTVLGHIVEGNTDLQKAKALRSGQLKKSPKKPPKRLKYNWKEVDSIVDQVYPEGFQDTGDEAVDFDSDIYDYVFSDDTIQTDELWDGLIDDRPNAQGTPAILEFLNGKREEVGRLDLFRPTPDEVTIVALDDDAGERSVPLQELCCIRLAKLPSSFDLQKDPSCKVEIIETTDGNIYHEYVNPAQDHDKGLVGFSTKEDTHFPYCFFPHSSIKLRRQERFLGEILLENRFISSDALRTALEEHQQIRSMQLGKIIARQDNILYSSIEKTIETAHQEGKKGLPAGEILLDAGVVNEEQVLDALEYQERLRNKKLGEFLIEKGVLREKELYISLAEKFRIRFVDLRQQKVSRKILTLLPREIVLRLKILPIELQGSTLVVASPTPDVSSIRETVHKYCPVENIEFVLAQPTHLKNVVNVLYQDRRASGS